MRAQVRPMLCNKLSSLHGEAFEEFFQELMQLADPGFLPVRTEGRDGDQSADGLVVDSRKLYACYAPQTYDRHKVRTKFNKDLAGAVAKRRDEFDTFVFVHNDLRGVAGTVSSAISAARCDHPWLAFEHVGVTRMDGLIRRLDVHSVEGLLGQFPSYQAVTGVGMAELAPLLEHLAENRQRGPAPDRVAIPPERKLDYNGFSDETRHSLVWPMRYVHFVETYYAGRTDPLERDETARGFRAEYLALTELMGEPDGIIDKLTDYILGNMSTDSKKRVDALVVLMYFFGECEIFKVPPPDWQPDVNDRTGGAG